jgi:hypothetical protein
MNSKKKGILYSVCLIVMLGFVNYIYAQSKSVTGHIHVVTDHGGGNVTVSMDTDSNRDGVVDFTRTFSNVSASDLSTLRMYRDMRPRQDVTITYHLNVTTGEFIIDSIAGYHDCEYQQHEAELAPYQEIFGDD